jgi:hypothetical protein
LADLIVLVPSRGRPQNIERLWTAIKATAAEPVHLFVRTDDDEPAYPFLEDVIYHRGPRLRLGATYNEMAERVASKYLYLALWNDDHLPTTPGWDVAMKRAISGPFGVAYAPDGNWERGELPTAPIVTSNMFDALGWVCLPGLTHWFVDNVWKTIGEDTDGLHFLPEVRVEHLHRVNGKAADDQTYRDANDNLLQNTADGERFHSWLASEERRQNAEMLNALGQ